MQYQLAKNYEFCHELITNIREDFSLSDSSIHKARNELKIIAVQDCQLVVKSFKQPSALQKIIYSFFRSSKAKRSFEYSNQLIQLGVAVPQPVAYVEFYQTGLLADSYYLSEKIHYDYTIRDVLDNQWPEKQTILKAFVEFTYELHNKGVYHLDYSPGNILVTQQGGVYQFALVDLNRMMFGKVSLVKAVGNFVRLTNDDDILVFFAQCYAKSGDIDFQVVKKLLLEQKQKYEKKRALKAKLKKIVRG